MGNRAQGLYLLQKKKSSDPILEIPGSGLGSLGRPFRPPAHTCGTHLGPTVLGRGTGGLRTWELRV